MKIANVLDATPDIAFRAYYSFVKPALVAAMRSELESVWHPGRHCGQFHTMDMCGDCGAAVDDTALDGFRRLSSVADEVRMSTTRDKPIHELRLIVGHVQSIDAFDEDVADMARRLKRLDLADPHAGPPWLRAAKAQLITYPTRHTRSSQRREKAVAAGAAARPERDLRTAKWSAPLRDSPEYVPLILAFIYRIRNGAYDPYRMPDDLLDSLSLSPRDAPDRLEDALRRLKQINVDFFRANIEGPLTVGRATTIDDPDARSAVSEDPEQTVIAGETGDHARMLLQRLISSDHHHGNPERRSAYADVVAAMVEPVNHDLIRLCTHRLGLDDRAAHRFLRRLAQLVSSANEEWVKHMVL